MSAELKQKKVCSHPGCNRSSGLQDEHDKWLAHNTTCFTNYEYDPSDCDICLRLFRGVKDKKAEAIETFNARVTAMLKTIKSAHTNGRLPPAVEERYQRLGTKCFFKPGTEGLDPLPRSRNKSNPTSPTTSLPQLTPPPHLVNSALENQVTQEETEATSFQKEPFLQATSADPVPGTSKSSAVQCMTSAADTTSSSESDTSSSSSSESDRSRRKRRKSKKKSLKRKHHSESKQNRLSKRSKITDDRVRLLESKMNTAISAIMAKLETLSAPRPAQEPVEDQLLEPELRNQDDSEILDRPTQEEEFDPACPSEDNLPRNNCSNTIQQAYENSQVASPVNVEDRIYYLPEQGVIQLEDRISFGKHTFLFEDNELLFDRHDGYDTFQPLIYSQKVADLIEESSLVIMRDDIKENRQAQFRKLTRATNKNTFSGFGLRTSASSNLTVENAKPSRFLESLQGTRSMASTSKSLPYTMISTYPDASNNILAFAQAPKLSKDCHKIIGALSTQTCEVPDFLRIRDHEIRQQLSALLFVHEYICFTKNALHDTVLPRLNQMEISGAGPQLDLIALGSIQADGVLPMIRTSIANATEQAKKIRFEIREKATANCKAPGIKTSLQDGSAFTTGLFDESAVAKAVDIQKTNPMVHVHPLVYNKHPPARGRSQQFGSYSGGSFSNFRGQGRGSSTSYNQRGQSTNRSSFSGRGHIRGYSHPGRLAQQKPSENKNSGAGKSSSTYSTSRGKHSQ